MRNRLEHFGLVASPDAIKGTAAHAVGFTIDFLHEQIGMDVLEPSAEELLERIRALSGEFQRYVEKRMKVLQPKIADAGTIVTCPACFQDAAAVDQGINCLFCHNRQPADEAADDFIAHIVGTGWRSTKDGLEWPRHDCPSCSADTLVDRGFDVSPRFLCFTCGETANLDWCPSCGRPATEGELGAGLCRNCVEDRLNRD